MTRLKLGLYVFAAVILAALCGWVYGWSGARAANNIVENARLRADLYEARIQLLDARVNLYNSNFGDASRNLEYAKPALTGARKLLEDAGRRDLVDKIDVALKTTQEAQRLSTYLKPEANNEVGSASAVINDVIHATR
jgi:hypothetical protein